MDRRKFLFAVVAVQLISPFHGYAQPKTMKDIQALQTNWKTLLPAGLNVPSPAEPLKLSKDEWKKRLSNDLAYKVLREESTERAGTSPRTRPVSARRETAWRSRTGAKSTVGLSSSATPVK